MKNKYKDCYILDEEVTYLNCANMSPMLRSVRQAGLNAIETRAAPWKISSGDWFLNAEKLRGLAAQIYQTKPDNIALVPSVSYALAVAAKNLKIQAGKTIVVIENQFPSNYYVWEELAGILNLKITCAKSGNGKTLTENILELIDTSTGLVSIPNCHWMDGDTIDLEKISQAARTVGSYLVLDLSQSLGALPIDIEKIQPDFAASVGYKWLLGPYGLGYMYVSPKWHDLGVPIEYSWLTKKGSEDFTSLTNYRREYRHGARKFDMGEFPQFNLLPMAIAALQKVLNWQVESIQHHLKNLTDSVKSCERLTGFFDSQINSSGHIVSIPLINLDGSKIKRRLDESKVIVSFRGTSMRISPHMHNTTNDIEKFLTCIPA